MFHDTLASLSHIVINFDSTKTVNSYLFNFSQSRYATQFLLPNHLAKRDLEYLNYPFSVSLTELLSWSRGSD